MHIDKQRLWHEIKMYAKATAYVLVIVALIVGGAWMVMWCVDNYPIAIGAATVVLVLGAAIRVVKQKLEKQ